MGSLTGRRIVVTGASSGIGRAVALRCAAEGARVLATGRRGQALDALGNGIVPHVADLTEAGAGDGLVAAARERLGGLDGLVHAAGTVLRNEDVRQTDDALLRRILDENLVAVFNVARPALRALARPEGPGGSLVLFSSQLGLIGVPGYASYSAAKGGVSALVRTLAVDFGPLGVRVNALAPGVVDTPMAYVDRDFDAVRDAVAERHPLRRIGQPEDLAGPAAFLLSDDAAWMTGQTVVVDGGFTIQ
jgi:NAD(P)-dependent dehydrogenase (short-subunit alcohol dehydrogenase family)